VEQGRDWDRLNMYMNRELEMGGGGLDVHDGGGTELVEAACLCVRTAHEQVSLATGCGGLVHLVHRCAEVNG
jgi:hypothetical protein